MPDDRDVSDRWLLVSIPAPPPAQALLVVDALRRVGARAVDRQGDRVVALFPAPAGTGAESGAAAVSGTIVESGARAGSSAGARPASVEAVLAEVRAAVRASTGDPEPDVAWRWRGQAEWAEQWRREQPARRVSPRIVVAPAGVDPGEVGTDDVVLRLEPGVAFGTAEHATTRACLALLDDRVRPGDRILDVGTGSGILAVAAALLGADRVLAAETDALSCEAARRNAALNGVAARVEVRELEVSPAGLRKLGRYDGVTVNIEARISVPLIPGLPAVLGRDGWLILSGLVADEGKEARAAADWAGLALGEERVDGGWWTGLLTRR